MTRYLPLALLMLLGVAVGTWTGSTPHGQAQAQGPGRSVAASPGAVAAFTTSAGPERQLLILVDPHSRAFSTYHIEHDTGAATLRSVRRFHYDLQMDEFNGSTPSPREIRRMLERSP